MIIFLSFDLTTGHQKPLKERVFRRRRRSRSEVGVKPELVFFCRNRAKKGLVRTGLRVLGVSFVKKNTLHPTTLCLLLVRAIKAPTNTVQILGSDWLTYGHDFGEGAPTPFVR